MPIATPQALSATFSLIIAGLRQAVGIRLGRRQDIGAMVLLLWTRLNRTAVRFAALHARYLAGTLAPPRRRAAPARTDHPGSRGGPGAGPRPRLPEGAGWLVRLVPDSANQGGQLQHLLGDPAMAEFLAAAPQAGRLLRPLCRMLGVPPVPALIRPEPPPPAAPQAAATPGRPAAPTVRPRDLTAEQVRPPELGVSRPPQWPA